MNSTLFSGRQDLAVSPIAVDLHMHTGYSHGEADVETMYLAARSKGLTVIGFSEHSPRPDGFSYPSDYREKLAHGLPGYMREVRELAGRGAAQGVEVLLGIEADYIRGREEYTRDFLRARNFDYIVGGLHFQGAWGFDADQADWARLSRPERFKAYARYYDDLAAMCGSGLFHIAAHPDLIKIFSIGDFNAWLDTEEALPVLRRALGAMREAGVLLEISSAGLRKRCGEIYPGPRIMALAAELGLSVAFASDAHCPDTPAFAFAELARYAASFGYTYSCIPMGGGKVRRMPFSAPQP
ncbi:MAG: histidinol-phosphatase [Desulfovibrio sp.]|nr:histidinol-phosphatase [Desulfovibrio sp.]